MFLFLLLPQYTHQGNMVSLQSTVKIIDFRVKKIEDLTFMLTFY